MGIELPGELAEVAAKAGVQWPQADEDAMRASATAWREAGDKIKMLSTDTDGSAGRTMDAMSGATGDAARSHWAKIVAPDGQFQRAAKGCHAAADRLDHAAQQVGQAKVEMVRELVTLAKNNDAANQAAAGGHPTALLGLDTAVRGTAANVANLSSTLSSAIRLDSGVDMGHAQPPVNTSPGAHGPGGGLLAPVTDAVAPVLQPVTDAVKPVVDTVAPVVQPVTDAVKPVVDTVKPVVDTVKPVTDAVPGVPPLVDTVTGEPDRGNGNGNDKGQGGLVPQVIDRIGTAVEPVVDTVTGEGPPGRDNGPGRPDVAVPIDELGATVQPAVEPVGRDITNLSGQLITPPLADGATATSGAATLLDRSVLTPETGPAPAQQTQAPAGPQAPAAGTAAPLGNAPAMGGPGAPAGPAAAAAASGVVGQAQGAAAQAGQAGQQAAGRAAEAAAQTKTDPKQTAGQPGAATKATATGAQAGQPGAHAEAKADAKPVGGQELQQGAVVTQDVGLPQPTGPLFTDTERNEAIAAALGNPVQQVQHASALGTWFLALVYPLGGLPRLSRRPVRQLPPPSEEQDFAAGQRFEPQDHPQHVDTAFADRPQQTAGLPVEHPTVQALLEGYDPLAGAHEHEWEARFVVRAEPVEYAWPPAELFPEGGYEAGQPEILDEGAELDRFGTPEGRVLSQAGTPFAQRSLPPHALQEGYHRYKVLRPLPVWRTISAPWFGQPGGGARYRTTYPVADLIALGYLMEITG